MTIREIYNSRNFLIHIDSSKRLRNFARIYNSRNFLIHIDIQKLLKSYGSKRSTTVEIS